VCVFRPSSGARPATCSSTFTNAPGRIMSDPFTTSRHALDPAIGNLWGVNGVNICDVMHWLPNVSDIVSGYVELGQKQTTRTSVCLFWRELVFPLLRAVTLYKGGPQCTHGRGKCRTVQIRTFKIAALSIGVQHGAYHEAWNKDFWRKFSDRRCKSHKLACKFKMWRRAVWCFSEDHPEYFL
jgi:hypothetical protein